MTSRSIEEQVKILRTTTERVGVSKEAAADFLRSAGIAHFSGTQNERAGGRLAKKDATSGKFVAKKSKK